MAGASTDEVQVFNQIFSILLTKKKKKLALVASYVFSYQMSTAPNTMCILKCDNDPLLSVVNGFILTNSRYNHCFFSFFFVVVFILTYKNTKLLLWYVYFLINFTIS